MVVAAVRVAVVVVAEQQRAQPHAGALGVGVAADHELLALRTLELDPGVGAAARVGRIEALADHAFEVQLAGRLQHVGRLGGEVFAEAHHRLRRRRCQRGAQQRAPLDQRRGAQVVAGVEGQVEQVVAHRVQRAVFKGVLQRLKIRRAVLAHDDDLAVEPGRIKTEPSHHVRQRRQFGSPVVAVAGEQARRAALHAREQPVTVELELVAPAAVGRLRVDQRGERWRQRCGQCGRFGGVRQRGRFGGRAQGRQGMLHAGDVGGQGRLGALGAGGRAHTGYRWGGGRGGGCTGRLGDGSSCRFLARARAHRRTGFCARWRARRCQGAGLLDARRQRLDHAELRLAARRRVALLDEQPGVLALAVARTHAHQGPVALQLVAGQAEFQLARRMAGARVAVWLPLAFVPHDHFTGAVMAGGNGAFEAGVVQRMVLDFDRHAARLRIQARTLGHRPALERAVELEPKVVMQLPGRMLLHHEAQRRLAGGVLAARLGRGLEVALVAIALQRVIARGLFHHRHRHVACRLQ